jgi:hypothetical protein
MTTENDVVLIHFEDKPLSFARIEKIAPDVKKDWYHVKLLLLQVPLQVVTWILRDVYIEGEEFTMDGNRMRLEKVVSPEPAEPEAAEEGPAEEEVPEPEREEGPAKIISLTDRKKS